jgi:tripartite-type tricarboxylate transporter receptor subunit TctC
MKTSLRKAAPRQRRPKPRGNSRNQPARPLNAQHPRRQFLRLAAGAAAVPALSRIAKAQVYPSRPVRIIVPFSPGDGSDIVVRLLGQWLSERLGQSFIVENRPGAGGNIGTEAVVRAAPDGYTLLWVTSANAVSATLYDKLNFDFIRDITPVASIILLPLVMLIHPSFPARSLPEFIAYAKANPGKLNMASPGTGTAIHVSSELLKMITGIDMTHVPYRGVAPALTDLLGGQVQVAFTTAASSIEYIKSGKLRPLAVTTAVRSEVLPDIPTVGEYVPGYEASAWWGLGAPKNTPAEIIEKLNVEINAGLANSRIKARLVELGGTALLGSPADFGKLIAADTEKWGKVIRAANIRPE